MGNMAIIIDHPQPHLSANKAPVRDAILVNIVVIVPAITPLLKRGMIRLLFQSFSANSSFNFLGHVTDFVPPPFVVIFV